MILSGSAKEFGLTVVFGDEAVDSGLKVNEGVEEACHREGKLRADTLSWCEVECPARMASSHARTFSCLWAA